ncbi:hypothetical protein K2Z83_06505 [Oscillochloris sp. ZM17-4]|uniref:hypothetical protein n=1 Tax=Oscillochloris sp. ZM17-4 TaxID=2866714 RepID=UPI001C72C9FB|nr:hypothetical protein [Oscillochloris sp. ZM17-4]MBX0327325.1 hypothetical protein [Oscillochloris sp. ZM17-4]
MSDDDLQLWIAQRLPPALAAGPPLVRRYADELVIMLQVAPPAGPGEAAALIARLREESRALRIQIAGEIERGQKLPVAWGMRAGEAEALFSSRTAPVMTRLARAERDVLDTLVAAGVAETRSGALAYAVRTFAAEHGEWLAEVRHAIAEVDRVRAQLHVRPRKGIPNRSE